MWLKFVKSLIALASYYFFLLMCEFMSLGENITKIYTSSYILSNIF